MILNNGGYELCHDCGHVLTTGMSVEFFKRAYRHVAGSPLCLTTEAVTKKRLPLTSTFGFITQDDDLKPKRRVVDALIVTYCNYRNSVTGSLPAFGVV